MEFAGATTSARAKERINPANVPGGAAAKRLGDGGRWIGGYPERATPSPKRNSSRAREQTSAVDAETGKPYITRLSGRYAFENVVIEKHETGRATRGNTIYVVADGG